jgi:hypothetical protein
MNPFLSITLVMLRILSEQGAVVWAMAHKKAEGKSKTVTLG